MLPREPMTASKPRYSSSTPTRAEIQEAADALTPMLDAIGWRLTFSRKDLPRLQNLLDGRGPGVLALREREALGLVVGVILVEELALEWALLDDPIRPA